MEFIWRCKVAKVKDGRIFNIHSDEDKAIREHISENVKLLCLKQL